MTMNNDTLRKVYDNDKEEGLLKFGNVVLKRSLTSKYSRYYYKYKTYYRNLKDINYVASVADNTNKSLANYPEEIEENPKWNKLQTIENALKNVYWYDKKIFELYYYEGNTLDSLAKKTGISRNSLFTTIDKVRELIKDKIND